MLTSYMICLAGVWDNEALRLCNEDAVIIVYNETVLASPSSIFANVG